jgi:retron-type reverse transcriptase
MIKKFTKTYADIISPENLLMAWQEFLKGKRNKKDVQEFQLHLMDNILELHKELENFSYKHGGYHHFRISDPKPRDIHKANVRDRLLHHAIYRQLYPFFDRKFIADSYSCRLSRGTHKALNQFKSFCLKVSRNHTKTIWILKCDIRKFFGSIDHQILSGILEKNIPDKNIVRLLKEVIGSFSLFSNSHELENSGDTEIGLPTQTGLPLGNLTSQILANVYMNEFDQFVKHKLKEKYYIRYADDFVFVSDNKTELENLIPEINEFLNVKLKLNLHPDKVFIKTLASGVDFLGWVNFPHHKVLRTATKRRMFKRIAENPKEETVESYLGMLKHGNAFKLGNKIKTTLEN